MYIKCLTIKGWNYEQIIHKKILGIKRKIKKIKWLDEILYILNQNIIIEVT